MEFKIYKDVDGEGKYKHELYISWGIWRVPNNSKIKLWKEFEYNTLTYQPLPTDTPTYKYYL